MTSPHVYKAMAAVLGELSAGIAKSQTNKFDKYNFRGIDDVYNALSPALAKHGLLMLPEVVSREVIEREAQSGKAMFDTTVLMKFTFIAAEDGSSHVISTYGQAMDRGDKGTNKAMSAAYKYAAFQAFAIPVDAQDADESTPETVEIQGQYKAYGEALRANWGHVLEFKEAAAAYLATSEPHHLHGAVEAYIDCPEQARRVLQMAPTKGGCLEVKERGLMKTDEFGKLLRELTAAANK